MAPVAPPVAAAPAAPIALLQSELDRLVMSSGVPGAQMVYTTPGQIDQFDSGVGDLGTGARFPDDSRVRIASITKTFVATVALQLVAENRIDLDAPLERYLPGVVHGPGGDGARITVRNLLQHTSGIPNYLPMLDQGSVAMLRNSRSADELIELGLGAPSEFVPGTTFGYSNTNYLLVGKLIERVTGSPVAVAVAQRILLPLGLSETYWPEFPLDEVLHGPHPRGYHRFGELRVDVTDVDAGWGLADGAMVSTGRDLNRFYLALVSGHVLPPELLAQMQNTIPTGLTGGFSEASGLGLFRFSTLCGRTAWGNSGSIQGFSTISVATEDRAVTVLLNELPGLSGNIQLIIGTNALLTIALCPP
ncbi:serine hydrolase domain-containing protein [Nocardia sp. NPDC050710]|uniref:serine hydrolase domain-containing protein n=1 Tax=Nocardia sp. NPDC050710 TaxID=3157220 RepID=UPI0033C64C27